MKREFINKLISNSILSALFSINETLLNKFGYFIVKDGYYCPIPNKKILVAEVGRWWKPSELVGLRFDVERMEKLLREIAKYKNYLYSLPDYEEITKKEFGPGYGPIDALLLAGMVRYLKPKRIIEIGSGLSTFYGTHALEANGYGSYVCVEPYPYPALHSLPQIDKIIEQRVETLDLSLFQELGGNDILFIDSSHTVKIGGDVIFLYLEVLPRLQSGVVVHIHDIAFPYPIWHSDQLIKGNRKWTEYALVQTFLAFNRAFEIMVCMSYLHFKYPSVLEQTMPLYNRASRPPVSLWIRRL